MEAAKGRARELTDDLLNRIAWSTEWDIAHAGNPVAGFESGLATHDCARSDLGGSHVAWLRRPLKRLEVRPAPCPHSFEFACASEAEGRRFLPDRPDAAPSLRLALWLDRERLRRPSPRRLGLIPARSEQHWESMAAYREEVEKEFSGYSPGVGRRVVGGIRHRGEHLAGGWHLALAEDLVVGGIGLVLFDTPVGRVGRLQDVDVAPAFRGRGLGRELLLAVCREAVRLDLAGLCLRADADDWPKDWYERFGFKRIGVWPYRRTTGFRSAAETGGGAR